MSRATAAIRAFSWHQRPTRVHPAARVLGTLEGMAAKVSRRWRLAELTADMRPPTDDDVPLDRDGNPLDSPEKVLAHLERINAERSGQPA